MKPEDERSTTHVRVFYSPQKLKLCCCPKLCPTQPKSAILRTLSDDSKRFSSWEKNSTGRKQKNTKIPSCGVWISKCTFNILKHTLIYTHTHLQIPVAKAFRMNESKAIDELNKIKKCFLLTQPSLRSFTYAPIQVTLRGGKVFMHGITQLCFCCRSIYSIYTRRTFWQHSIIKWIDCISSIHA